MNHYLIKQPTDEDEDLKRQLNFFKDQKQQATK